MDLKHENGAEFPLKTKGNEMTPFFFIANWQTLDSSVACHITNLMNRCNPLGEPFDDTYQIQNEPITLN